MARQTNQLNKWRLVLDNGGERSLIAGRLQVARKRAGLSQGQVAAMLTLHRPAVSEIEAGRRAVSAEELGRLAEIYDVELDWLLGRSPTGMSESVELAARELNKLKLEDLDRVLELLRSLRAQRKP